MPAQLQDRIRELEIDTDLIKKQMLASNRDQWALAIAKLQAAYSELEQCYAALAVETILDRSRQKQIASAAVPNILDLG
jgi:hypothetical protein